MKKVHFLHIPKTAGQSVHDLLDRSFESVSPLRVNAQINDFGMRAVSDYDVVSGHIDWDLMLKGGDAEFTFTILRKPIDRILSFYFFLRAEAKRLSSEQLGLPENSGKRVALQASPNDYFCSKDPGFRSFVDNHYDNFYSYFFASRRYSGCAELKGKVQPDAILRRAFSNLGRLNKIYTINNVERLGSDLESFFDIDFGHSLNWRNRGDGLSVDARIERMREVGSCDQALTRIKEMTKMDDVIYDIVERAGN